MRFKARPTSYKGIKMRSRLEAQFAGGLDEMGLQWEYEPRAFASGKKQYLPDFLVDEVASVWAERTDLVRQRDLAYSVLRKLLDEGYEMIFVFRSDLTADELALVERQINEQLMAEGYAESAAEDAEIAEAALAAQYEALDLDDD